MVVVCYGGVINAYFVDILGMFVDMFFCLVYMVVNVVWVVIGGCRVIESIGDTVYFLVVEGLVMY